MKSFAVLLSLFFLFSTVLAESGPDSTINNEIKEEITTWNHEALNIILIACQDYLNQLVEKRLLFSNASFSLAIQIKEAMEKLEEIKEHESYAELNKGFKKLVNELPLSVVTLIWSSKTHLFNKGFSCEYLYTYENVDGDHRSVYTWVYGGRDKTGVWEFSTDDDGKSFFIKSVHTNELFYAGDESLAPDEDRKNVFTWSEEASNNTTNERRWIVEIQGDDEIMFKSKDGNEYFYAEVGYNDDEGKRKAFNWRGKSPCDDTCEWILSPEKGSIVSRLEKKLKQDGTYKFSQKCEG
jgi:hypothetical protein